MAEQKFTTGSVLFNQGIGSTELLQLMRKGLVSYPVGRTPGGDPCYFCAPLMPGNYPPCLGGKKPCEHSPLLLCDNATEEDLHSRLSKALFPSDALGQLKAILSGTEAQREDAVIKPAPEELPDSPEEFVQNLKRKRLDDAEIKHRLYSAGKKKWNLTWWKVHCIVEGLSYPPKGRKGEADRTDYKDACLRQIKAWQERS